jgi:(1->4)-alpha-D-glucan 1-alpha-D-glucosylmutase
VVAFVRGGAVATVVQRLPIGLDTSGGWRTTTLDLPPGVWRDGITRARHEGRVLMSDLFAINPFALLVRVP